MTEKPDYILTFDRPKNTEIKKIGNNWYLYERFSKYDPTIKRSRKVSGRCLGKITPDGLIATKRRLTPAERPAAVLEETVEVGASLFMWKRTEDLRKRLQVHFPDQWQQIYVAALLRLLREPRFKPSASLRKQHLVACFPETVIHRFRQCSHASDFG